MKQSILIKVVDLCSFIALTLIVSTGTLLEFTLPARSGRSSVWGLTRHQWGDVHWYVSIFFLLMMSLHLLTHLKYIKQVVLGHASSERKYRVGIGLVGMIALIVILLAPVLSPVEEGQRGGRGYGARHWQQE
ncbi:DUF4405 domain-containing protein [Methylomarinum sp. Ch1-1]|uniref:DUF4405 domain-containing protein n=1 Tax=Methylomarinum roseum TaxID=3067653 RepID=A0AAU7NS40_9GAMM|nr:DUF4405 domain-containing protein [Methylomarinum sp. Ch1-1]MDP4520205.1 DUF4405 domain-containing protein [Methylomarinum sp. Ch1-1]